MQITFNLTSQEEKFLKKIYGDKEVNVLARLWFSDWINSRVDKAYIPTKTLNEKIDELTKPTI